MAAYEAVDRLLDPQQLDHLLPLAVAGVVGFLGNELAAVIRLRAGRRLQSPALVADGMHARTDGLVIAGRGGERRRPSRSGPTWPTR